MDEASGSGSDSGAAANHRAKHAKPGQQHSPAVSLRNGAYDGASKGKGAVGVQGKFAEFVACDAAVVIHVNTKRSRDAFGQG